MEITVKVDEKFDRLLDALCILLEAEIKPVSGILKEVELDGEQIPNPPDNSAGGGTIPPPPDNLGAVAGTGQPALNPGPAVELDAAGMPWDARIHGKKKDKLAKTQEWKKIRGVDKNLVTQVEAELKAGLHPGASKPIDSGAPGAATPPPIVPPVITPPAATGTLDKIMGNVALWAGAGTFLVGDVAAELLKLNIPNLAALPGIDENILTVLDYNLGQAWTIKNTPA